MTRNFKKINRNKQQHMKHNYQYPIVYVNSATIRNIIDIVSYIIKICMLYAYTLIGYYTILSTSYRVQEANYTSYMAITIYN